MVPWLVRLISLGMMLQLNSTAAENFTDEAEFLEDDESSLVACSSIIKVEWNVQLCREPHVIKYNNGSETFYDGLFPQFLDNMLSLCCAGMFKIKYVEGDSDITLPVILNYKESGLRSQHKVVPILPYTGVAFVVKREDKKNFPIKTLSSIFSSWPVLVLTLLLSVLAGIVAWMLDTRKNKEEFPMSFMQGSWEGFWWAFVSMTTVGEAVNNISDTLLYVAAIQRANCVLMLLILITLAEIQSPLSYGDRCPKSISGRLFAIVWILTGICMCSIFTAMLTASLTTISLDTEIPLPQAKVAALFGSIEATTGFQRQADVIRALMDSFTLTHYQKLFPANEFKVQEVISQEYLEYGARVENSSLASCLKNLRFSEESELYEYAEFYMLGKYNKTGMGDSTKRDESSFQVDPEGLLFYPALFTCLGILAFFLLSGATWEICRRSRMCTTQRADSKRLDCLLSTSHEYRRTMETKALLQELEEKVVQDVRQVLKSLQNDLVNTSVYSENNGNDQMNEKLTSV